jgi:redox-sensing transcriptional repressor
MISEKTIERLSLYRQLLYRLQAAGKKYLYSYELASQAGVHPSQIRYDMMSVGYSGNPSQGYEITKLIDSISEFIDPPADCPIALAGVGNLGRAILSNMGSFASRLRMAAAFDVNPDQVDRLVQGCWCYPASEIVSVVREQKIVIGIIAVPVTEAQGVAEQFCEGGVRGLLNFAPTRLRVPPEVHVDNLNINVMLEKVAFFTLRKS